MPSAKCAAGAACGVGFVLAPVLCFGDTSARWTEGLLRSWPRLPLRAAAAAEGVSEAQPAGESTTTEPTSTTTTVSAAPRREEVRARLMSVFPEPEPQLLHARLTFQDTLAFPGRPLVSIAASCDWLFIREGEAVHPSARLVRVRSPPATVFVDQRFKLKEIVRIMQTEVLPKLEAPVVVFTTSQDRTLPLQLDARFRPTRNSTLEAFSRLLDQRLVDRWVTENLDDAGFHRKLVAVPTGFYTPTCESGGKGNVDCSLMYWPIIKADWIVPLSERPLTVSCNGNLRDGNAGQFEARRVALENCKPGGPWSGFSEYRGSMNTTDFPSWWQKHSFVICTHGGGLDPSPRAFMAIAAGAIPIVQRSALDTVYSQLPVAFVDDWGAGSISLDKMRHWRAQLAPHYEEPELVAKVIAKMTMQYWWRTSLEGTTAANRGA